MCYKTRHDDKKKEELTSMTMMTFSVPQRSGGIGCCVLFRPIKKPQQQENWI